MSYNIYASSPGILVTAADYSANPQGPVVLLPHAYTIGNTITVKDAAGQASAGTPITVSTILDAYYARTLSTSIISSVQITAAGGSITVAPLQPRTYALLDGPLIPRTTPNTLRPNYEQISTLSTYTASVLSSLTLQPTVALDALRSFSAPAELTAEFTSTLAASAGQTNNLYSASSWNPHNFYSTGSISTNNLYVSTFTTSGLTASNYTGLGVMDICGTGITTVSGNYSTIVGGIVGPSVSARLTGDAIVRGAFSTLGNLDAYGTGGINVKDDFYGASNISVGSIVVLGAASFGSNLYVGDSARMSTLIVHDSAAYTSSITIGEPTTSAGQTWDVSGSMYVTASLREATTLNAILMSTATLYGSTFNVYNTTSNEFYPLSIQGGNLYYGNSQVGAGGGGSLDYATEQTTVSSFLSTMNLYASTAFVGASTYRTNFQLEVNGGIKLADVSGTCLRVAGGAAATPANTLAWSVDGITWNAALSGGFTTATYGLGWNGRQWLALGADSGGQTIEVSADGKTWSASGVTNPFAVEGHAAAWNGERWVAVGAGSGTTTIKTSTDGYTWTDAVSGGFSNYGYDVAWNGRLWVAVGDSNTSAHSIQYSYDASNWSNATSGSFDLSGSALAWNGRIWVAVGSASNVNARIKRSTDGLIWTDSSGSTAFSGAGTDVVWSGQVFHATGSDATAANRIKFSYDGSVWSNSVGGTFTGSANAITYDGEKWIVAGTDSTAANQIDYSYNGRSWSATTGAPFTAGGGAYALAYGYDVVPRLKVADLEFYEGVQPFYRSTNTIFTQPTRFGFSSITHSTSMVINNTIFINSPGGIGINIDPLIHNSNLNIGRSTVGLYVFGSTFVNSPNAFKVSGTTWTTPSDSRLKDEICTVNHLKQCMCKLDALKQKEFCYKDVGMRYVNRDAIQRRNAYVESVKDSVSRRCASMKTYNIDEEKVSKLMCIDLRNQQETDKELGFIAEDVAMVIPEAIEPIQINGQTYLGLNYEQIQMVHLATTHALMSTIEIQESTLKGQDDTIEALYANYNLLRDLLNP
jgi:hypothetical protein